MSPAFTSPKGRKCHPSPPSPSPQGAGAVTAARLALGKQMYLAGIDDGKTYESIATLTRAFLAPGLDLDRQTKLQAERERLLLQLADAALQYDAPLPGAEREYDRVRALAGDGAIDFCPRA